MKLVVALLGLLLAFWAPFSLAGVYVLSTAPAYDPFIIVHPKVYSGTGGALTLKICTEQIDQNYWPALAGAVKKWNQLTPLQQNCQNCFVHEDTQVLTGPFYAESTFLHELGHCIVGLDHTAVETIQASYTNTKSWISFDPGPDALPGTSDDVPFPLPGARVVHWFRISDNDPVKVDATPIDQTTYSRNFNQLPVGHSWPANGNRVAAAHLGYSDSGSVMYTAVQPLQLFKALQADEVNTVRMAQTGLDLTAGTADDYTLNIELQESCSTADIRILEDSVGSLGVCDYAITQISGLHYRLSGPLDVTIDSLTLWDFVLVDNFESGNTSRWSASFP